MNNPQSRTARRVGLGGRLVISQRAELKTLNPLTAGDENSKEIIGLINADLIHINRYTQKTEAALANSWTVSADGRIYTLELRSGIRFSDGQPFDADDVLFTFQVYLDEHVHSPQRDLLVVGGKPIQVRKLSARTVQFELAQPYAAAERLFDSIAILPRHLLKQVYDEGTAGKGVDLNNVASGDCRVRAVSNQRVCSRRANRPRAQPILLEERC